MTSSRLAMLTHIKITSNSPFIVSSVVLAFGYHFLTVSKFRFSMPDLINKIILFSGCSAGGSSVSPCISRKSISMFRLIWVFKATSSGLLLNFSKVQYLEQL